MKKMKDEKLFQLIREFLTVYLPEQKLCSSNTIKSYKESINLLLNFLQDKKQILISDITFKMLNFETISEFLKWLEQERNCTITTTNQRLACIRSFFNYAGKMDFSLTIFQNEVRKIPIKKKMESHVVDYLTENALKAVLSEPNITTNKGIRDLFYMILLYDSGARNRELLNLKLKDLNLDSKTPCIYLIGKGNKKRVVPIMEKTVSHYHNYMKFFHDVAHYDGDKYLFYVVRNGQSQQMSDDNVARFMKAYGRSAHQKCAEVPDRVHPHQFRHARAMHLYQAGMPLVLISEWFGHAQLETTLIYAYADTEMKRAAIEKATNEHNPMNTATTSRPWKDDAELIRKLYGLK